MKKIKIIGMVLATNFVFEIGKTLIKNKIEKSVLNKKSNSRNTFEHIIFENTDEAQEVVDCLLNIFQEFGVASVADLYDLVGITPQFIDNSYGWRKLTSKDAIIKKTKLGYVLKLPETTVLD